MNELFHVEINQRERHVTADLRVNHRVVTETFQVNTQHLGTSMSEDS